MKLPERDIHCHLLPGVDDGFRKAEESLAAIRQLSASGVREIVFTPHLNPDIYKDSDETFVTARYNEFMSTFPDDIDVKISLAAEYMVVKDFEERASDPSLLKFEDGSILIEMSYYYPSPNLEQTIFELNINGLKPILAHPERYLYMADHLDDFVRYSDMGCRMQLNLMSLTGAYGRHSVRIAKFLLDKGLYSFVATDLHSLSQLNLIQDSNPVRKLRKRMFEY